MTQDKYWQAESLRITALFEASDPSELTEIWPALPEAEEISRTVQRANRQTSIEGMWSSLKVSAISQDTRVDWTLSLGAPKQSLSEGIGRLTDLKDSFIAIVPENIGKKVTRLAFGTTLLLPAASHAEAYATLAALIPGIRITDGASDFIYQINRPRNLTDIGLTVNRLGAWSAIKSQRVVFTGAALQYNEEEFCVRIDLDINTHQLSQSALDGTVDKSILNQLAMLAVEIEAKGDIA